MVHLQSPVLALMYHHIAPPPPAARIKGMYVTPRQLDWHIRWLKGKGFRFTTLRQLSEPATDARPRVILTFDDGYRNNYDAAFPILRKHGVPAVIFPVVGALGKDAVVWPEASEKTPAAMLSADQIREMAAAGVEFGSHLLHHARLTGMTPAQQREELEVSKSRLEFLLQQPVHSIAYPFGAFDAGILDRARQAGYRYGVITDPGLITAADDPLALKRFTARGCKLHHPMKFWWMINGTRRQIQRLARHDG